MAKITRKAYDEALNVLRGKSFSKGARQAAERIVENYEAGATFQRQKAIRNRAMRKRAALRDDLAAAERNFVSELNVMAGHHLGMTSQVDENGVLTLCDGDFLYKVTVKVTKA